QHAAARGADAHRVPRRTSVRARRLFAARAPGRPAGHLHLPAEPDEMKPDFIERVNREMAEDFPAADLPAREALAAACRILAAERHESGLAGQLTARAERANAWWTLAFGVGF